MSMPLRPIADFGGAALCSRWMEWRSIIKPVALLVAGVAIAAASFGGGYTVAQHRGPDPSVSSQLRQHRDYSDPYEHDALRFEAVKDALNRWAMKNGTTPDRMLQGEAPRMMFVADRACVQFVRRNMGIGGAPPVYCYELDKSGWPTTKLVFESSELGE